jgi:vacuolar-type H+-ATPase subunit H
MDLRIFTAKAYEGVPAGESNDNVADLIDAAIRMSPAEQRSERLRLAQAAKDAQHEADRIVTEAREKADEALSQAAKIVREAREQAARIISEASSQAEQILENAHLKRSQILEGVYLQKPDISEDAYQQRVQACGDVQNLLEAVQSKLLPWAAAEVMHLAQPTVLPVYWAVTAIADVGDITALKRLADHAGTEVTPKRQAAALPDGLAKYLAQNPQAWAPEVTISAQSGTFLTHQPAPANYTHEHLPKHESKQMLLKQPWATDVLRSNEAKAEVGYEYPTAGFKKVGHLQKYERPETPDPEVLMGYVLHLNRNFLRFSQPDELMQPGEEQNAPVINSAPQIPPVPR